MATRAIQFHPRSGTLDSSTARTGPAGAALSDAAPFAVGLIPFSLTLGAAIASSNVDHFVGWLGGPMLIGGTSHLASISMLDAGAGAAAVIVTALMINLRVVAYSAAIAPRMASQPAWFRWVAAAMLVDQSFAMVTRHLDAGKPAAWIRRYYLVGAIPLWSIFIGGIGAGVLLGPVVPVSWELGFSAVLLFVGMVAPATRTRSGLVAALVAFAVTAALTDLPNGAGLVVGGVVGAASGALVASRKADGNA